MTYRGVVSNGVVVIEGPDKPPEGTVVEITPVHETGGLDESYGFGMWRDRAEMADPVEAARQLGERIFAQRPNGTEEK